MRLLRGCEGEMLRAAGSRSSCTALVWSAVMRSTMIIMIHVLGAGMYSMMFRPGGRVTTDVSVVYYD